MSLTGSGALWSIDIILSVIYFYHTKYDETAFKGVQECADSRRRRSNGLPAARALRTARSPRRLSGWKRVWRMPISGPTSTNSALPGPEIPDHYLLPGQEPCVFCIRFPEVGHGQHQQKPRSGPEETCRRPAQHDGREAAGHAGRRLI